MNKLILVIFCLALLPSVSAEINFELSSSPPTTTVLPGGNYQHPIELQMGANETGDNLLIIDVMYEANAGWDFAGYTATLNGLSIDFNVAEKDESVSGKHRITLTNSSIPPPLITDPKTLSIVIDLTAPDVAATYAIDTVAMWSFPTTNKEEIVGSNTSVVVSEPSASTSGGEKGTPAKPEIVLLANSIDYNLSGNFTALLNTHGIDIIYTNPENFTNYSESKFIVILGGPDAYEGVGGIVREVLNESEQNYLRTEGNRKMYVKTNVWARGQVVMVIAGSDREQTQKAGEENKLSIKKKVMGD